MLEYEKANLLLHTHLSAPSLARSVCYEAFLVFYPIEPPAWHPKDVHCHTSYPERIEMPPTSGPTQSTRMALSLFFSYGSSADVTRKTDEKQQQHWRIFSLVV
jgi:hypothetical protein